MVQFVTGSTGLTLTDPTFILNTDNLYLQCRTDLGAVNITLPAISTSGKTWGFKIFVYDYGKNSAVNNITITPNVADDINGTATPIVINTNGSSGILEIVGGTSWRYSAPIASVSNAFFYATLAIPSASVLTLNTAPLTIVPALTGGKKIIVISGWVDITFNTIAYATNVRLQLINEGAGDAQYVSPTVCLDSTISKTELFVPNTTATAGNTQVVANTALQVKVATGNPTAGNSNIVVNVAYIIRT